MRNLFFSFSDINNNKQTAVARVGRPYCTTYIRRPAFEFAWQ